MAPLPSPARADQHVAALLSALADLLETASASAHEASCVASGVAPVPADCSPTLVALGGLTRLGDELETALALWRSTAAFNRGFGGVR